MMPTAPGTPQQERACVTKQVASTSTRRPMISTEEVRELADRYGPPARRSFKIQADDYIRSYRWRRDSDRRAEVIFAIEDPLGRIWVHSKANYPAHIFRLPSGGVDWEETVVDALYREVDEETSLGIRIHRFVGLIEYRFVDGDAVAHFASYVFHVRAGPEQPVPHGTEEITAFRSVLPGQLAQTAADLRNLFGDRRGWGQWRALAHDLVSDHLTG